jgi:hypothetical protein
MRTETRQPSRDDPPRGPDTAGPPDPSGLQPWYVTGFVEGAGSFTFNRSGDRITLAFAVRMKESNRRLLEELRRFFGGAGRIYSTRRAGNGSAARDTCLFRINRTRDLLRVVEHFNTYPLRGDKRKALGIWREMVFVRATHHGRRPPDELNELAEQLARATRRPRTDPP